MAQVCFYAFKRKVIELTLTDKNTTWFDAADDNTGISLIADIEGGMFIVNSGYNYPVLIYDVNRSDINHNREKAK